MGVGAEERKGGPFQVEPITRAVVVYENVEKLQSFKLSKSFPGIVPYQTLKSFYFALPPPRIF